MNLPFPCADVEVAVESPQVTTALSPEIRVALDGFRLQFQWLEQDRENQLPPTEMQVRLMREHFERIVQMLAAGKCYAPAPVAEPEPKTPGDEVVLDQIDGPLARDSRVSEVA